MISYKDWMLSEGKVKLYELYIKGPGIDPVAEKAVKAVKDVMSGAKSFLVLKFRGTKEDVAKVEKALAEVSFNVVEVEIEHD